MRQTWNGKSLIQLTPYENRELFAFSWKVRGIKDEQIIPLISDMYLRPNERFYKRREIDTRKLKFRYYWINLRAAAQQGRVNIVRDGYDADGQLHTTIVGSTAP
jgi:sulfatase modifying factor 1